MNISAKRDPPPVESDSAIRYQAWLVDLDGTLYHARWVRLAMALELSLGHWGAMSKLRIFRHEHENLRKQPSISDLDPYRLQIARAAERLNCTCNELETLVYEWMHQRPGKWLKLFRRKSLLREIERFRQTGGRTALVSDYPAAAKLVALSAKHLFDVVVASGETEGLPKLKPDPSGYLLAAKRLGMAPEACLVIGDRADADGEAARRAGMGFRRV